MEPDETTWLSLRELFMTWPEGIKKNMAYELADQKIDTWNDQFRCLVSTWNDLFSGDEVNDFCRIVRTIRFHRHSQGATRTIVRVAESSKAANLKCLIFIRSEIEEYGFKALTRSPFIRKLERLEFHHMVLTNADLNMLFRASNLNTLKTLIITHSDISGKEAVRIFDAPYANNLEKLDLSENLIKNKYAIKITKSFTSRRLRYLNLKGNPISDPEKLRSICSPKLKLEL
jgi:hypothetical protein